MVAVTGNRRSALRWVGVLIASALFAIGLASSASADDIHTYPRSAFADFIDADPCPPQCHLTGSFRTLIDWTITIPDNTVPVALESVGEPSFSFVIDATALGHPTSPFAENFKDSGTWVITADTTNPVPEASSLILLGTGLLVMVTLMGKIIRRRHQEKSQQAAKESAIPAISASSATSATSAD